MTGKELGTQSVRQWNAPGMAGPNSGGVVTQPTGMTLRQHAAIEALNGLLANPSLSADAEGYAADAILFADALLERLARDD